MHKVKISHIKEYNTEVLSAFFNEFIPEDISNQYKKILIKPNLLLAANPEKAITTHPIFVNEIIKCLKNRGIKDIYLADSPGGSFIDYERILKTTGMWQVCKEHNVNIVKVEAYKPKKVFDFIVSSIIDDFDLIINLPKLKTHSLMGLTLSVKNLFGFIPATFKVVMHKRFPDVSLLAEKLYKLYTLMEHKTLHFLDGIIAMEGEGPSRGKPIKLGIVATSNNAVALDIAITELLGFKTNFCKTNEAAIKNGFDRYSIDVAYLTPFKIKKLKKPLSLKVDYVPNFLKSWFAGTISVKPTISKNKCVKCKLCLKSCPANAIKEIDGNIVILKNDCLECFCCYELCEHSAINLHRSLFHRLFIQ